MEAAYAIWPVSSATIAHLSKATHHCKMLGRSPCFLSGSLAWQMPRAISSAKDRSSTHSSDALGCLLSVA